MADGAKIIDEVSAFAEANDDQMMIDTASKNQASVPAKKRKRRKVAYPKMVEQGYDDKGNGIEII